MTKWEYKYHVVDFKKLKTKGLKLDYDSEIGLMEEQLNALGEEGWELVHPLRIDALVTHMRLFLKRPKQ